MEDEGFEGGGHGLNVNSYYWIHRIGFDRCCCFSVISISDRTGEEFLKQDCIRTFVRCENRAFGVSNRYGLQG